MGQIGEHERTTHDEPREPAPLFAPPVRLPQLVPLPVRPVEVPQKKAA